MNVGHYFGAKMVTFCIIQIGNGNIFLKYYSPPRVPTNPFARKCTHILHNICEKLVGTRRMISHSPKCDVSTNPNISIWIFGVVS